LLPPNSITFTDVDLDGKEISGTVTIERADDEKAVEEYAIYWSDRENLKLDLLLTLGKSSDNGNLTAFIAENTAVPPGATRLLVVTRNSRDEMDTGASAALIDFASDSALPQPGSVTFKDSDGNRNVVGGALRVTPPIDDGGVIGYNVFWADENGDVLSPPHVLASRVKPSSAAPSFFIDLPDNTPVPDRARYLLVAAYGPIEASIVGSQVALLDFFGNAQGRGPGGNPKMGSHYYGEDEWPPLSIYKSGEGGTSHCYLDNGLVMVVDMEHQLDSRPYSMPDQPQTVDNELFPAFSFPCGDNNENTNRFVNGALSPLNDAFYFGNVSLDMFYAYLGEPPLTDKIRLRVHYGENLAFGSWDGAYVNIGDGNLDGSLLIPPMYPLSVLEVVAHEIGHGFTRRYSNLYQGQAEAINEAFSDMTGKAAEHYLYGTVDWPHDASLVHPDRALRYFAHPSDDGKSPESVNDYEPTLSPHHNGGIFRKAFYLLVDPEDRLPGAVDWSLPLALKAFALANKNCWRQDETFSGAAQCVQDQALELLYEVEPACFGNEMDRVCLATLWQIENDIRKAFAQVDIALKVSGTYANFTFEKGLRELRLDDASQVAENGRIETWRWDFGDGKPPSELNTQPSPTYRYDEAGDYWVSLTVTDSAGDSDTYTKEVRIASDYCEASAAADSAFWIAGVSLGDFSQFSGNSAGRYYATDSLGLMPGQTATLHLLPGMAADAVVEPVYWRVWIDYNRDGEFAQEDELVYSDTAYNPADGVTAAIQLPETLPLGQSRMRVAMRTFAYPNACGSVNNGEVEDYTVVFQSVEIEPELDFSVDIEAPTDVGTSTVFVHNQSQAISDSQFQWDFGDGTIKTGIHSSHVYTRPGIYQVSMIVTAPDGGQTTLSQEINIDIPDGYCPAGNDAKTEWERIQEVTVSGVSNVTGGEASGYRDFTPTVTVPMAQGESVNYVLTPWLAEDNPGPENWWVWIDYDQNQVFEDDEQVVDASGKETVSGAFTVPADARTGTTRMRVVMSYVHPGTADPCYRFDTDSLDGGQVEDYSVEVSGL